VSCNLVALQAWRIPGGVVVAKEGGFDICFCSCFVGGWWFIFKVAEEERERKRKRKRERREKERSEAMKM